MKSKLILLFLLSSVFTFAVKIIPSSPESESSYQIIFNELYCKYPLEEKSTYDPEFITQIYYKECYLDGELKKGQYVEFNNIKSPEDFSNVLSYNTIHFKNDNEVRVLEADNYTSYFSFDTSFWFSND